MEGLDGFLHGNNETVKKVPGDTNLNGPGTVLGGGEAATTG